MAKMNGFNFLLFLAIVSLSTKFIINKELPQPKSKESLQPKPKEPLQPKPKESPQPKPKESLQPKSKEYLQSKPKESLPLSEKLYAKTIGQIRFDKVKGRTPAKGSLLGCVLKCSQTFGCHCLRVAVETNECEIFLSTIDDPNSEKNTSVLSKYVYFTMNANNVGTGENLALNKRVIQSSTYNQYQATKAVDNNNKTESKTGNGKDKSRSTLPWLQIDLNDNYVVTGVVLLTKEAESLHNFEIRVGDRNIARSDKGTHFKENPVCFAYLGSGFLENNKPKLAKCEPCPLMGKYVSIQIVNNCTECQEPGINLLNLAEVEIYGYLAK